MRLKNKIAVVTGGASGIGEATVVDMINEGARVVIADMDEQLGEALALKLNERQEGCATSSPWT